jgi:TonB-dependent receptor
MASFESHPGSTRNLRLLRSGVSVIAICSLAAATPALAQEQPDPTDAPPPATASAGDAQATQDTNGKSISNSTSPAKAGADNAPGNAIVVTGIRQSLRNAQNIKRNSDTIVDAITSQDIGALPDRSVTEALQRVPGVSINRFGGPSDPDHFSVEGSGVIIRGLTFVRSEFNGRDTFSAGIYGQGINFADVPAELLGSVEVYKQMTADRIEGALSGSVNMNLRLPFDSKGFHVGYDAEANYGDFRKKWSPVGSLLVSNTWDTGIGRVGILGAAAYSRLFSRSDGLQVSNFQLRDGTYALAANTSDTLVCRAPLPSNTDQHGFPPNIDAYTGTGPGASHTDVAAGDACYGTAAGGPDGFADFLPSVYAPIGGQFRTQDFDRKRKGFAGAFQWQSLDRRMLLTAQFLRSKATQRTDELTFEAGSDLNEYNTFPAGCRANANGPIQGGYPNQTGSIRAQCPIDANGNIIGADGTLYPNYQYDENGVFEKGYITLPNNGWRGDPTGQLQNNVPLGGIQHTLNNRQDYDSNLVQDHAVNFKFSPTPHWDINLDGQYVKAEHDNISMGIHGSLFADQELDLTGKYPVITPHKPLTLTYTWAQPTNTIIMGQNDEQYFADPTHTFWRSAMDHIEHSNGHEWAFKGDAAYNFLDDGGFLKQLKFGARWADREQTVRSTAYNWGALSEVWAGGNGGAVYMNQFGADQTQLHTWDNFFRGKTAAPPAANYYAGDLIGGYDQAVAFAQAVQDYARAHNGDLGGNFWVPLAQRPNVVPGTPFLPSEIQHVSQKTDAAYTMLRFGSDDPIFGNVRLDGNIGVRFVHDKLASEGSIGVPSQQALNITDTFAVQCTPTNTPPPPPAPQIPTLPAVCSLGQAGYDALRTWATGVTNPETGISKYSYWLPSLNLKFGLSRDLIFRLAASRDFARPSLGDIRNFLTIGASGGGSTYQLTATAGNPFLKPALADNFDATLEWYFGGSHVGSITFDAFAKNIHNYFYSQVTNREITNNGVTENVLVRGPANYGGTGKVRGLEIAYQQTYDFLPGLLSGLGLSASYTYLTSKGLPNSFLNNGLAVNSPPNGQSGDLPLAQLSKHTINLAPFYEKGPISLRVAYNWRSKFLLTESDVIFPYDPIWQDATGSLDASFFYTITPALKVGVQAQNITNTVTKTLQQFNLQGDLGPRSYFMNDRRFSLIVRGSFGGSHAAPPPPLPPAPPPPPPATQTCPDGTVVDAAATCPPPPLPPAPPPAPVERGERGQ